MKSPVFQLLAVALNTWNFITIITNSRMFSVAYEQQCYCEIH